MVRTDPPQRMGNIAVETQARMPTITPRPLLKAHKGDEVDLLILFILSYRYSVIPVGVVSTNGFHFRIEIQQHCNEKLYESLIISIHIS